MQDTNKYWNEVAQKQFVGRKIVGARYMTEAEAEDMGWDQRPVVLILDDGNQIFPSRDDEGNDGGALFTTDKTNDVLPVLR